MPFLRSNLARRTAILAMLATISATAASAHDPYIYPANGQSPDQQDNDNYHCYRWAMDQTGYDPTVGVATAPPTANALRGAAGGAALGAVGGAIGGNVGAGAAIGAGVGAVIGGARRRNQQNQQSAAIAAGRGAYDRAFSACMTGKGYTVR
jgi:hypothetical protein